MCGSNPWRHACGEVYMIGQTFDGADCYIVMARNSSEDLFYFFLRILFFPNLFSIFCTENNVIPQIISYMTCSFHCHHSMVSHVFPNRCFYPLWFPEPSSGACRGVVKKILLGSNQLKDKAPPVLFFHQKLI